MGQFLQFEEAASRLIQQYQVPGCMVAIAKDGKIIYEKAFGFRDKEKKLQIDGDTVFGIASLTKSFTCAAIMKLQEEGRLDVEDSVITYLPELQMDTMDKLTEITIAHFMTHSSGLPPLPSLDVAMIRRKNKVTPDYADIPLDRNQLTSYKQFIDFIKNSHVQPICKPGTLFSYSNDAYGLLGAIIERVSGMSYEEYVMEQIIKPCGMERTHFLIGDYKKDENITTCYEINEDTEELYIAEDWWDAAPMRATGFLKSTVNDMMRYARLYLQKGEVDKEQILSVDSLEAMLYPHIKMDPEKMYGYGFAVTEDYHGSLMVDHGGSLQSISSKFAILPEDGISAIVLTNLSGFPAGRVLLMALNAYYGRDLDVSHLHFEAITLPQELLNTYIGNYSSGEGMDCILEFSEIDGIKFLYKKVQYPITFVSENVFTAMIDDIAEPVEVLKDEDGHVCALSIFHRVVPRIQV